MAPLHAATTILAAFLALASARKGESGKPDGGRPGGDRPLQEVPKEVFEQAREAVAQCQREGLTNCNKLFYDMTGKNLTRSGDPQQIKNAEQMLVLEELNQAVGSFMAECLNKSATNREKALCRDKVKELIANSTNSSVSGDLADKMMEKELREAGRAKAAELIRECIEGAETQEAKSACLSSPEAIRQAALASGRNESDFTPADLKRAANQNAQNSINSAMRACVAQAEGEAQMRACREQLDLRGLIANATAKDKGALKDSDVREFMAKGAEDAVLLALKACDKGTDSATMQACMAEARRMKAEALGKNVSELTDLDVRKDLDKALGRDIMALMEACMANVTEDRAKCKEAARATMKDADVRGKEPKDYELERMLERAAMSAVQEARESCESEEQCEAEVKERIARNLGMRKDDVTTLMAREFEEKAAVEKGKESMHACMEARRDDSAATCDDPYVKYLEATGRSRPADAKKAATQERKAKKEMVEVSVHEVLALCLEQGDPEAVASCMEESKAEADAIMQHLGLGQGLNAEQKQKRLQHMQREANVEVLGQRFGDCMAAARANGTDGKRACMEVLEVGKRLTNMSDDAEGILKKFQAKILTTPSSCSSDDMKECRQQAREEAMAAGLAKREFAAVKKVGELRGAAEEWAACNEADGAEVDCDEQAREKFLAVSGTEASSFDSQAQAKVRNLARAIMDGKALVLIRRKRLDVTVGTSATSCSEAIEERMANKTEEAAAANGTEANATKQPCRLVDDVAEYAAFLVANLTDQEFDRLADALAAYLEGRDLSSRRLQEERRLATVDDAYASQDLAECAEGDAACADDELPEDVTPSPTPANSPTPTPSPPSPDSAIAAANTLAFPAVATLAAAVLILAEATRP